MKFLIIFLVSVSSLMAEKKEVIFDSKNLVVKSEQGKELIRVVKYMNGSSIVIKLDSGFELTLHCDKDIKALKELGLISPTENDQKKAILINAVGEIEVNEFISRAE